MAHLYSHLRVHQIFGANTDVGKTIFTTALCLASAALRRDAPAGVAGESRDSQQAIGEQVHYLKPVATGPRAEQDDAHLNIFAPATSTTTLFRFDPAVSPHLAAERLRLRQRPQDAAALRCTSDTEFARDIGAWISDRARSTFSLAEAQSSLSPVAVAYVETAGGVHSPAPSGSSQASALRPLRLPTILVGSSALGGIGTTRSAFESLMLAGYDVDAILLFPSPDYGNVAYLQRWATQDSAARGVRVFGLGGPSADGWGVPPSRAQSSAADQRAMRRFYEGLLAGRAPQSDDETGGGVLEVVRYLRQRHQERIGELQTLAQRTRDSCWWPFTQHNLVKRNDDVTVIDSAHGDFFMALAGTSDGAKADSLLHPVLDGSASWWTQCLGHSPARLTKAAARAAARYGHVIFPSAANEPAVRLAETLTGKGAQQLDWEHAPGAGWADRAFFSDDGSTGMEVALKMAIASSVQRYAHSSTEATTKPRQEWEVLGLKGSYHGDTIGAMDACEGGVFNSAVEWYRGRGHWLDAPVVEIADGAVRIKPPADDGPTDLSRAMEDGMGPSGLAYADLGSVYDVKARLRRDPLTSVYRRHVRHTIAQLTAQGRRFGALVLEPLVMGAGGMICVDPLFQRCLVDVVRESEDLFSAQDGSAVWTEEPREANRHASQWKGLPVVFDEVFTGLYRLGYSSPARALGTTPDVSVLAKILTGGLAPMSVTLASSSIFDTFARSERKHDALLHGHSYTAYPIGCEIANEALSAIAELVGSDETWARSLTSWGVSRADEGPWSLWGRDFVHALSQKDRVESVMALGTVLIVTLRDQQGAGYSSNAAVSLLKHLRTGRSAVQDHPTDPTAPDVHNPQVLPFNIHARPLGNVVYFMTSLNTPRSVLTATESILSNALE